MDRFIGVHMPGAYGVLVGLKSNMDRFIADR